ncbi:MAG: hypothetical protein J6P87_04340 [Lachnospiraceae bacterium]|nr:hypothetical protein [Lachnospiraceae bacterium]
MNNSIDISMALDYRRACGRLGLTLIPVRGHEKMLASVPYTAMEDLALIYKVELGPADSIIIDQAMLEGYGVGFEKLREDALLSAPRRHPCVIRSLAGSMRDLMENTGEEESCIEDTSWFDEEAAVSVYTATTVEMCMGACVIAYPGMLEKASVMMGGDFFILPSSIHEVLLVKACEADCRHLIEIVSEVNRTVVDRRDWLSDNVYYYAAGTGDFMTAGVL